jgi:antitoxin component YwqK of YwqJK toxin-antitoxin module
MAWPRLNKKRLALLGLFAMTGAIAIHFLWKQEQPALPEVEVSALERVGDRLHLRGETEPFSGRMVRLYEDGQLQSRSEVREGVLHGLSEGWYPDGTLEVREFFRKGISHGTRVRWHPDGTMASRAPIVDGEIHGLFERWHPNGRPHQRITMEHGRAHGPSTSYYPSGYIQARVEMDNGSVETRRFWEDGEFRPPDST